MKTSLEIPDRILRRAKSAAAERGIPFHEFITETVIDKLAAGRNSSNKPWMATLGKLRHLDKETARIHRIFEEEFEQVETEDRF